MSKFTPGPWVLKVELEEKSFDPITGEQRKPGAHFRVTSGFYWVHSRYGPGAELDVVTANARLIAAAPSLLSALERVLGEFNPKECNCDGEYTQDGLIGQACYFHRIEKEVRLAIAKATGVES